MTTLILRSNLDTTSPVELPSIGTFVPSAGGSLTFTDPAEIQNIQLDADIQAVASDSAFVGGTDPSDHSIIYNLDGTDVDPSDFDDVFGTHARYTDSEAALAVDYAGSFDQPTQPSTGDIADGQWAWWYDTVNARLLLLRRRGATIYCVEATPI